MHTYNPAGMHTCTYANTHSTMQLLLFIYLPLLFISPLQLHPDQKVERKETAKKVLRTRRNIPLPRQVHAPRARQKGEKKVLNTSFIHSLLLQLYSKYLIIVDVPYCQIVLLKFLLLCDFREPNVYFPCTLTYTIAISCL